MLIDHVMKDPSLTGRMMTLSGSNWKDCRQELLLILCEKDEAYLKKIQPYFDFWCVRTIRNMNGNRGVMAQYRTKTLSKAEFNEYEAYMDEYVQRYSSDVLKVFEDDSNELTWYEKKLFKAYIEEGSMDKLSKATQIPKVTIWDTINEIRFKLKWAYSK
jgi:hypothetical protein